MLFWAMNLNFYDVMKKIIYFSTIVSLIFPPYSKCINICYYDEVWFDLLLMMLYKKEKYFWNAIKIQQKIINKNLVHLHGLQASLYITKNWSVAFNTAALTLRHINCHVILFFFFFFSFLKYNLSYNFKMVFTIFSLINVAHYLFIYLHYHPKINPVHYLFIYFHYHPIINLYN